MAETKQTKQAKNIEPKNAEIVDKQEYQYKYFKLDTSKLVALINKELSSTSEGTTFLSQHKKEDIIRYLQSPLASQRILRQISNLLYNLSPQYRRLLHYFADMTRFDYIIDINNLSLLDDSKDKILKKYLKMAKYVDVMNIKHEFSKITKTLFIEDVFYGYDYETDHSYTIQKLPPDFCRLSGTADGCKVFEFDFQYFRGKNKKLLDTQYGEEFRQKFEAFEADSKLRWQELSLEHSICLKLNEELDYPIPFFSNLFPDIFDLSLYKQLKMSKTELENYIILVGKIGYLKESGVANNFNLDLDTALEFGGKIIQQLPDQVAFLLSPYDDVKDIHLGDKNKIDNNSVVDAEKSFWNSAGVNDSLFNSDKISQESIRKSIQTDENLIFSLYHQVERLINRKIKLCLNDDFKISILDSTDFNFLELAKAYKEAGIYGIPVKRNLCAVLGLTPLQMESAIKLEEVLNFEKRLKPLVSGNTLSPDKKDANRPSREIEGGGNGSGEENNEE